MDASSLSSTSSSWDSLFDPEDLEASFSAAAPLRQKRGTYRSLAPPSPARFFFEELSDDHPHHFLDSCFLCKKPLAQTGDIFMYRGDTPFCSEECREEQIQMDEAREKSWKIVFNKEQQQQQKQKKSSSSPNGHHVRAGALVVG